MSFGTQAGAATSRVAADAPATRRWRLRRGDGRLRTVELTVTRRLGDVLDAVTVMGVDKAQGFHVGRPMPVAELLDLVRSPVV